MRTGGFEDMALRIYNTLTREKDLFVSQEPGKVKMYVCGPTVYDFIHIGNARPMIVFDVVRTYLEQLGNEVNYVVNFTDIDDKLIRKAEQTGSTVPEVADTFIGAYYEDLEGLGLTRATLNPRVTENMDSILEFIQELEDKGFAYENGGDVFYRTHKFKDYGKLSHQNIEELQFGIRIGVDERKEHPEDFVLWKAAKPGEIAWSSPWGDGRPGWHIECSAMSQKYLGDSFDIHGGGMDLAATHHTNEIAQSEACNHVQPAKYWMHTNMLTVNGTRMSKSAGNGFLPLQLFSGDHPLLHKGYSPMAVRFFMMQAHYRSTLDFSNEALDAAEKGFKRLMSAITLLDKITVSSSSKIDVDLKALKDRCYAAMDDDFNSPILIAELFELVRLINSVYDGKQQVDQYSLEEIKLIMQHFVFDVMGLKDDQLEGETESFDKLMELIISMRNEAKQNKDFATSDRIRQELSAVGIQLKDSKDGTLWNKI